MADATMALLGVMAQGSAPATSAAPPAAATPPCRLAQAQYKQAVLKPMLWKRRDIEALVFSFGVSGQQMSGFADTIPNGHAFAFFVDAMCAPVRPDGTLKPSDMMAEVRSSFPELVEAGVTNATLAAVFNGVLTVPPPDRLPSDFPMFTP
jgi:hypothetical protein